MCITKNVAARQISVLKLVGVKRCQALPRCLLFVFLCFQNHLFKLLPVSVFIKHNIQTLSGQQTNHTSEYYDPRSCLTWDYVLSMFECIIK